MSQPKTSLPARPATPLDIERVIWDLEYRAQLKRELNEIADLQGRRWTAPLEPFEAGGNIERFPVDKVLPRKTR
jgi:hypothetical protein